MEQGNPIYNNLPTTVLVDLLECGRIVLSDLSSDRAFDVFLWEPPPMPLASFHLGSEEHRREFLWQYYWQGETTLFAAVAHVWDSLGDQRAAHGTLVGLLSGTGGKGKTGIVLTLQKFLRECLDGPEPLPAIAEFAALEQWHQACKQSFADDEAHARRLCAIYSDILDGRPPAKLRRESRHGEVMAGPWRLDFIAARRQNQSCI